jgi:hypothetical protein
MAQRPGKGKSPQELFSPTATAWVATKLFRVVTLHGFFNLSTWLTAIAGAAAYHLVSSWSGAGRTGRRSSWAHR